MKLSYVYFLSNVNRTSLFIGVAPDLQKRISELRQDKNIFAKRRSLKHLLYFEGFPDIRHAQAREKQLRSLDKEWKWNLIMQANPKLEELVILYPLAEMAN